MILLALGEEYLHRWWIDIWNSGLCSPLPFELVVDIMLCSFTKKTRHVVALVWEQWILSVQRITKLSDKWNSRRQCSYMGPRWLIYPILSYSNVLAMARYLEIEFMHVFKGILTRSKIVNTHALCPQNFHIVPTEHVQFGVNIHKNRSFDARKWPLSLLLSRILLLVRPPTRVYHLHEHSISKRSFCMYPNTYKYIVIKYS